MATENKKQLKDNKFGLTGTKKKIGINYWRFEFNAVEEYSGAEQMFFIELEMINPWLSPNEILLGFKPRVKITSDDLQYALAGTQSAQSFDTESIIQPSYCSIRVGKLGETASQLCSYFPVKEMSFYTKPFEVVYGECSFSEDALKGCVEISTEEKNAHPEYLCDCGSARWDLKYETQTEFLDGYNNNGNRWFPSGLKTTFTGKITFDGVDYLVDSRKSAGYIDRYWGRDFPDTWFHISSSNLTSVITGRTLFNSSFAVKGIFDERVSFLGKFDELELEFLADSSKRTYNIVWDCSQMPQSEDPESNLLHWSLSIDNKNWVVDIDVFCRIKELFNRNIELPEGGRKVMNLLQGATGTGEFKLYRKNGTVIEQIEHAQLTKVICEFGHTEEGEF